MSESPTDLLPLYESSRGFDTAMRGYDREQVDREVSRLDDEVRITAAERDTAANRSADLAAQLASAHAQAESLRRQLHTATETVTPENVDERVRAILTAAKADAAKLRQDAQAQAEQTRGAAADSAARTRAAAQAESEKILGEAADRKAEADEIYRQRIDEADAHRARVEAELAETSARTRAEEARLTAEAEAARQRLNSEHDEQRTRLNTEATRTREAQDAEAAAERARLDAEARAIRERANEDFEITLRLRRSKAAQEQAAQKAAADAAAARAIADAQAQARQLIADATHEVRRLHDERDVTHTSLESLYAKLRQALDESLAETPPAPALADTGSIGTLDDTRPMPSRSAGHSDEAAQ
jgi:cell division septum initiation protein DivIVA